MEGKDQHLLNLFSTRLLEALYADSSLQSLVSLGYEALENPFAIMDLRSNVIAISGESKVKDDPVWNETINCEANSFQTFSYYVDNKLIEKAFESTAPFFWSDPYSKYPRIMGKIMIEGKHIAHIIVCAHERDFKEGDLEIVSMLCQAAAIELQKNKNIQYFQGVASDAVLRD